MNTFVSMLLVSLLMCAVIRGTTALECNGMAGLCNLRINQVTFPGAHNAGAGFNGILHYWSGIAAGSCWYRNVYRNFKQMLDFGVRFFDIDTCLWHYKLESCHANAYGGSFLIAFDQIDSWMKSHPHEVIILNFNRDAPEWDRERIAGQITHELKKRWNLYNSNNEVRVSTHAKWPTYTLREAIDSKQRIFIFMDNNLWKYAKSSSKSYLYWTNGFLSSTWKSSMHVGAGGCSVITDAANEKCGTNEDMIELSAFGGWGLCVWDMAWHCSNSLQSAMDACYSKRQGYSKTVNVVLVDYPASNYHYGNDVVTKARNLNKKNIQKYTAQMKQVIDNYPTDGFLPEQYSI